MISRILISVLVSTIALASFTATNAQTKRKHKQRIVTIIPTTWEPEPDSLFYKLTRGLPTVTKVEISHIQSALGPGALPPDVVLFQGKEPIRILATRTLLNHDAAVVTNIWRRLKRSTSNACFAPAYLLKFYSNDRELFATIVCFACQNIMLPDGNTWGFDARNGAGLMLLNELKVLLAQSPNNSLDASGGSEFHNLIRPAMLD